MIRGLEHCADSAYVLSSPLRRLALHSLIAVTVSFKAVAGAARGKSTSRRSGGKPQSAAAPTGSVSIACCSGEAGLDCCEAGPAAPDELGLLTKRATQRPGDSDPYCAAMNTSTKLSGNRAATLSCCRTCSRSIPQGENVPNVAYTPATTIIAIAAGGPNASLNR
jgi:hypothetical protein